MLLDANILLYAKFNDFPQHAPSRNWLDTALNRPDPVGMPWVSLTAFVRISTNRRIMRQPLGSNDALRQIKEWTQRANVWMPEPRTRFMGLFSELVNETQATGNLITDAYLAALAREHGLTMISTDSDFARFPELDWFNPLGKTSSPPA